MNEENKSKQPERDTPPDGFKNRMDTHDIARHTSTSSYSQAMWRGGYGYGYGGFGIGHIPSMGGYNPYRY